MFFERIRNIDPEKVAFKYEGQEYTYAEIIEETKSRATYFSYSQKIILLNKTSQKDNLFDFLACMYIGVKAIFLSSSLPKSAQITFAQSLNGLLSTTCLEQSKSLTEEYVPKSDTVFLGVLSSGTEGEPKVIWKDYQAWFTAFEHQSAVFGIAASDTVFVLDGLSYSANLNAVLHALWQGCTVVLGKLSEAGSWRYQFEKEAISSIFMVPSHLNLLKNSLVKFINVRSIVTAGEKLKQNLAKSLVLHFPNALLTEYYGAAELGHISYIQGSELLANPNSVGRAFPLVEIYLKDSKLFVTSPYVSPDYRKNPTVSDLGEISADGLLYLLGRQGRMYNKRGLNIYAQEIENIAEEHTFVTAAYLMPVQDHEAKFTLWVAYSSPISNSELRAFLTSRLSSDKMPNYIHCLATLPRLSSGKINFKALKKIPSEESIVSK